MRYILRFVGSWFVRRAELGEMRTMRFGHAVTLIGGMAVLLCSVTLSWGYELNAFTGESREAAVADFAPRWDRPENKHNKFFSEQYSFDCTTEDGGNFWFQIVISNMSIASGRAALRANFTPPGGKKTSTGKTFNPDEWSYRVEGRTLTITLGKSVFSGDGLKWQGRLVLDKFISEFTITNLAPAWKPGGGAVYYGPGDKAYYDVTLLTPRGTFRADVTPTGGEKVVLRGVVYGDYSVMNVPPNLQAKSWIKMRQVTKNRTVALTIFQTSEQYGSKTVGWFVVASGNRIVGTGLNPKVELFDIEVDSATGYEVPRMVLMTGAKGLDSFEGVIKAEKLTRRDDKLSALSAIERAIVTKIVKPVDFAHSARFEFRFKEGTQIKKFSGKATYHFEQVTK